MVSVEHGRCTGNYVTSRIFVVGAFRCISGYVCELVGFSRCGRAGYFRVGVGRLPPFGRLVDDGVRAVRSRERACLERDCSVGGFGVSKQLPPSIDAWTVCVPTTGYHASTSWSFLPKTVFGANFPSERCVIGFLVTFSLSE